MSILTPLSATLKPEKVYKVESKETTEITGKTDGKFFVTIFKFKTNFFKTQNREFRLLTSVSVVYFFSKAVGHGTDFGLSPKTRQVYLLPKVSKKSKIKV